MANQTTALAPIEPRDFSEAQEMASTLAKAATLPLALRGKTEDVLMSILAGRELGVAPMAAIRGIHIIDGKPTMAADLMVGLILRQPACKFFRCVESTDKQAAYETLREGHPSPTKLTMTLAQAQRAGLTGKTNWKNWPEAMLRARCAAHLARMVYPDILAGVYDPDELPPAPERDVTPRSEPRAEMAAQPAAAARTVTLAPAAEPPHDAVTGELLDPAPPAEHPLIERIRSVADQAALDALVAEVGALKGLEQAAARTAWIDRQRAISAGRAA